MTERTTLMRRLAAGVGAFALATVGFMGASSAYADSGPDQPGAPKFGTLTIHKRVGSQGEHGDGTEIKDPATPPGSPLAGVDFTIWRLGKMDNGTCVALDMSKTEDWESMPTGAAPATLAGVQAAGFCLVDADGIVKTTDDDGELTFGDGETSLPLGLYYVQETKWPASVISKAAPFYVSIPMPYEVEEGVGDWLYDVHAYPKNKEGTNPSKTINPDSAQTGLVVGSTVEWTITQTVPALQEGEAYTSASIWDYLPAELEFVETVSVKVNGAPVDYSKSGNVVWTLTNPGALKADDVIVVVFKTKVLEVTESGDINNPGSIDPEIPGYGSEFNGGKVPGDTTPYTYWGKLKVTKVDENGDGLEGAEFKVYPKTGAECSENVPTGDPVSTGVSGSGGVVLWTPNMPTDGTSPLGLFVANSDYELETAPSKDYCLYETKAPAGYTGTAVSTVTIKPGDEFMVDVDIENVPRDVPHLPQTGSSATVVMMLVGLGLVGTAGVLFAARRTRTSH